MIEKEKATRAKRAYRGTAQAEVAALTRRRILDAALALAAEEWLDRITLDQVAARAGVTVQTIIRHFSSKEGLFAAAAGEAHARAVDWRGTTAPGDIDSAVRTLTRHYEAAGDRVLRALAQEDIYPGLRAVTDAGRAAHRAWVERTFAPFLEQRAGRERERFLAELVAITDVYVWKLLRHDMRQDQQQTAQALRDMLAALCGKGER